MEALLDLIAANPVPGLVGLLVAAFLEYVFPPFPGDTVTLFGGFLVTARNWSAPLVLTVVTAGSLMGVLVDFLVGAWLVRRAAAWRQRPGWRSRWVGGMDRAVAVFARHGAWAILLNRFLPGIRGVFFVAAGMARMRLGVVLLLAAVSAGLWNLLVFLAGMAVGHNFERLRLLAATYTRGVWAALAVAVAFILLRFVLRARLRPHA